MSRNYDTRATRLDASGTTPTTTDKVPSTLEPSPTFNTYRQNRVAFPNTINIRTQPTAHHEIADIETYGLKTTASISRDQPPKLRPEEWLPCSIVDLYAYEVVNTFFESNPHRAGDVCLIPSGTWFHMAEEGGQLALGRQDPNVSVLEYRYVAFPANGTGSHFFLCIIAHASDLLVSRNPTGPVRTTILIFDSLGTSYETSNLRQKVLRFLSSLCSDEEVRFSEFEAMRLIRVPVPRQPNGCDCGLYPGHFLSVFLSDPEAYTAHCLGDAAFGGTAESIWATDRVTTARKTLESLVQMATRYRRAAVTFDSGRTPDAAQNSTIRPSV